MNYLEKILPFFPKAELVNEGKEIVIEPKNNIYFRLDNIENEKEFDYKIIEWCSRSACKGLSDYWQRYMLRGINSYFKKSWSQLDMEMIYTKLGNGVNRKLCVDFFDSNFDLEILKSK